MALGSIFLTLLGPAWADSSDDNLRLLREQQQEFEQLRRQQQPRPSGETLPVAPPAAVSPPDGTRCLPVDNLRWQGEAPLDKKTRQRLEQQFSRRCLDAAALAQLLQEANLALLRAGYITSRALLRDDAYAEGTLTLTLVRGYIARVNAQGLGKPEVAAALPDIEKGAFNLRDLEQGLDQLNRLTSNQVQAELQPGQGLGESELLLVNKFSRRWHGFAGLDNGGSPSTGRAVASAGLGLDNLIGSGDFWNIAYRRSISGDSEALSQSLSLYASQPFGYWTGSASLGLAESKVPLTLPTITLHSRTRSSSPSLRLERVLSRNANSLWTAQLALSRRKTNSAIEDERLDISSPTSSSAELALQYDSLSPLPWSARLSRSQGLRWFGADRDSEETIAVGLPRAQFEKWRLDLHARYAWGRSAYLAEASAQYSPHRLPGAEELVIGDSSSVRGFQEEVVSARRGWYLRQTFSHFFNNLAQPYVGLDGAHGQTELGSDWLGSFSLGWRASARGQSLDVSFSRGWRQEAASPSPRLQARYSAFF